MAVESSMKDEVRRETACTVKPPDVAYEKINEGTSLNAWINTNNYGRLVAPVEICSVMPQGSSSEEMLIISKEPE